MRERPLSPHLSIYRFRYTLTTSIANRVAGFGLSIGLVLFVWWLVAAAGGSEAYGQVHRVLAHIAGRTVLALFVVAFVYHTLAGIRHLIWDTGRALERRESHASAWLVGVLTVVVSAVLIYLSFIDRGGST